MQTTYGAACMLLALVACGQRSAPEPSFHPSTELRRPSPAASLRARQLAARQQAGALDPRYQVVRSSAAASNASLGALTAQNPSQRMAALFRERGAQLTAVDESWHLALEPIAVECGSESHPIVSAASSVAASGPRADYARSANHVSITESYTNGPLGVEQSFELERSPCPLGTRRLDLKLALSGLSPTLLEQDGVQSIELRDATGAPAARYSELFAEDAQGRALASRFSVAANFVTLEIDVAGATWPVLIDPLLWTAGQDLPPPSADAHGSGIALDGDTVLLSDVDNTLGQPRHGWVWAFTRSGSAWTYRQTLQPPTDDPDFSSTIALSGDTALIKGGGYDPSFGSVGRAYVFVRSDSDWVVQQALVAGDPTDDSLGAALAVSGDTALLSSTRHDAAYVFRRSGSVWAQEQSLNVADLDQDDVFGDAVALDGDTALVSRALAAGGHMVHVFVRSGSSWSEQQRLEPSAGELRPFVALSGDTALIAGYRSPDGVAYVYERTGAAWSEQPLLIAPFHDLTGSSGPPGGRGVALLGDNALVVSGSAGYLFRRLGGSWHNHRQILEPNHYVGGGPPAISSDIAILRWWSEYGDVPSRTSHVTAHTLYPESEGPCSTNEECASGHCVEGVCCDSECSGRCHSCLAARKAWGADGMCGIVKPGTDPRHSCPDESGCTLDVCGVGECEAGPPQTACGARCINATQEKVGTCHSGQCRYSVTPLDPRDHGPYPGECNPGFACRAEHCQTSCGSDDDCDTNGGYACYGGDCQPRKSAEGTGDTPHDECERDADPPGCDRDHIEPSDGTAAGQGGGGASNPSPSTDGEDGGAAGPPSPSGTGTGSQTNRDGDGCGCRAVGGPRSSGPPLPLLAVVAMLSRWRRRSLPTHTREAGVPLPVAT